MPDNLLLTAALAYESYGFSVIPCRPGSKIPAIDWKQYQEKRASREQIEAWWKQEPNYNVAVVTGEISGISVVDVDGEKGEESLRTLSTPLPETRTHKTPHGRHHIYLYQSQLHTGANFLPGIDVRSDGGIVIMPPSKAEGLEYKRENRLDIEEFDEPPEILLATTRGSERESSTTTALSGEAKLWISEAIRTGVEQGGRDNTATRIAGYLYSKGIPKDIVYEYVYDFGLKCNPPLEESDIIKIVESTGQYHEVEPEHTASGLLYRWPELGIKIHVDSLRRTLDGCKCLIRAFYSDDTPLLAPAAADLLSVSSRGTLIRALTDRVQIDWNAAIEHIANTTLTKLSDDEPTVNLKDFLDSEKPTWLLHPFILGDGATIVFGQGGLGKSLLTLAAMLSLELDAPVIPGVKPIEKRNGLYLDWEDSAETQAERFSMLLRGQGLDPHEYGLLHRTCSAPLSDSISTVKGIIDANNISYLVIDSAALACGGGPESADGALNFFNALNRLKVPSLIIAHQVKNSNQPYPFGSIFWHNSARCTWEIKGRDNNNTDNSGNVAIRLLNQKSNRGAREREKAYEIIFTSDQIKMRSLNRDERLEEFGADAAPLSERIRRELLQGPLTTATLANRLDKSVDIIRAELNKSNRRVPLFKIQGKAPGGRGQLWTVIDTKTQRF